MKFIKNKVFFAVIIFSLISINLFSESKNSINTVSLENKKEELKIYTLQNGFTIFVLEDYTSALVHSEFLCRAGLSSQSPSTVGFFSLYADLFLETIKNYNQEFLEYINISSSCNSDNSRFISNFPNFYLEEYFEAIFQCAAKPSFSDSQIKKHYKKIKLENQEYKKTTSYFINSAIDSKVFSKEPWKQEALYNSIFDKFEIPELRTILNDIGKRWYTPNNCALFISGNVNSKEIYKLADKIFSEWTSYYKGESFSFHPDFQTWENDCPKKYVLYSDEFSEEINQIVIQYTSLNISQANILAEAFNNYDSNLVEKILADPILAVRGQEYINTASAQKSYSSRLIIQSLMENPYSFSKPENLVAELPSPREQAELFVKKIIEASSLNRKKFVNAQNNIIAKYKSQTGNSINTISSLADFWSLSPDLSSTGFYQKFQNLVYDIQNQNEKIIHEKILNEEPFIFLLINTKNFQKYADDFINNNWEVISKKTKIDFKTSNEKPIIQNEITQEEIKNEEDNFQEDIFYNENFKSIKKINLKNNIPVYLKENTESQNVNISLIISGGELASPKEEKLQRTILINAFARNIQDEIWSLKRVGKFSGDTSIKAWTNEINSYINIICMKEDFELALQAAFNAIIYGEITPFIADNLVSEQAYQYHNKTSFLTNQLKYNALEYLYRNSDFKRIYDLDINVLEKTNYDSISIAYTDLLNAALYSFIIVGDINTNKIDKIELSFEKNFSNLLNHQERIKYEIPLPSFKNKTRHVQLQHLFTTDLPAELAPKESPVLIPTKDFFDPAQLYFTCPESEFEIQLYNALLLEFENEIQKDLEENPVKIYPANSINKLGIIQGEKLEKANSLQKSYEKSRKKIIKKLETDKNKYIKKIKSIWMQNFLSKTQNNEGTAILIQEGLINENPYQYLENYIKIKNASVEDFVKIMNTYFPEEVPFIVYSVDSKK